MSKINKKIKCVAFDADNTLYITQGVAESADRAAMTVLSEKVPAPVEDLYSEWKEIVQTIKTNPDPKIRHRKYSYGELCKKYDVDFVDEMYEAFMNTLIDGIKIVPGILGVLDMLEQNQVELHVLTEDEDKEKAVKKLKAVGIFDYFANLTTSEDVGTMKPSEKYYTTLLDKFSPDEVLVVGDNFEKDLSIPDSLGMQTLLITNEQDILKIKDLIE